ncbi:MAG: rane protein [Solirubrobacteraceae bacterium]|jgi:membrane protein|nr:rane protein [Solirubrobacteraceae bacterium]
MDEPENPTDIPTGGWLSTAKRAFVEFRDDDMPTWAAALTYYAVLSVFPALIVLVALIGLVGQYPQTSDAILNIVGSIGPKSAVDTLRGTIEGVVRNKGGAGALLGIGLVFAIWSASSYIGAFFKAANAIFEVEEGRPVWKLKPIQLGLTIFFLVISAFGAVVFVASGSIAKSIGDTIGLGQTAVTIWSIAKWPVLAVAVMILIAVLYWAAPNVKRDKLRWLTPGGAIGLVTLLIASALFALYVSNFGSYNKTYGTLAFVPLFLTWLWIANLALLFGAEFDAELERERRIEAGMRPVDAEPFLPLRDAPKESKDGSALAREQVAERDKAQEAKSSAPERSARS